MSLNKFDDDAYHRNAHVLADLFDDAPMWGSSSMGGLEAPIGWDDHDMPVMLRFSAGTPHALMGGNTGSGKSNLIHVIICSLCYRYSPEELQIRFLDMKDGIETFRYVDKTTGKAWLPHIKLSVSENSENPAEVFLDEIISEIHKRNSEFKCEGVASFSEFRKKTGKKMPRILVVIEGLPHMFLGNDSGSRESEILQTLQMLLAKGRSCGVHVILAAQLMSQTDRLILGRMPVRLALPGASGVLANGNDSDNYLRLNHCIINEFSGECGKNNAFTHPLCDVNLFRSKIDGFHKKELRTCVRPMLRLHLVDDVFHRLIIALERLEVFLEVQRRGDKAQKLVTTAMNGPRDLHDDLQHPPSMESMLSEVQLQCMAIFFQTNFDDEKLFTQVMEYFMTDLLEWYAGRGMDIPYDEVDRYILPILVSMSRQVVSVVEIKHVCDDYVDSIRRITDLNDVEREKAVKRGFIALINGKGQHRCGEELQKFEMFGEEVEFSVHKRGTVEDGYNRLMDAMLNLYDTIIPAKRIRDILTAYVKNLPEYTDEALGKKVALKGQNQGRIHSKKNSQSEVVITNYPQK